VLLAAVLGVLLAVAAISAMEYFNDTLNVSDDLSRFLSSPILGTLGYAGRIKKPVDRLITILKPYSPIAEGYRLLRTNILAACADDGLVPLVVTSPGTNEGKSFTSANLAVSFAQASQSVILVDADIRNPVLHQLFSCSNDAGLANVLNSESSPEQSSAGERGGGTNVERSLELTIEQYLVTTHVPGLRLLPSGPLLANPAELLGSAQMSQTLRILQRMADLVILDSPPVLPVADTTLLAGKRTAVLLVLEVGRTKAQELRQANEMLHGNRSRVLGIVLNKVRGSASGDRRYTRYYRPSRAQAARGSWIPFLGRSGKESEKIGVRSQE
jgi:Mrp family chromosome partitioning ATPase